VGTDVEEGAVGTGELFEDAGKRKQRQAKASKGKQRQAKASKGKQRQAKASLVIEQRRIGANRPMQPRSQITERKKPIMGSVSIQSRQRQPATAGTLPGSAGRRFRDALPVETPLQAVGAANALHALLAKQAGFRAIYLSGGGVSAGSLGMPDLGIIQLEDVLIDVRRITAVCELPLLVDVDTGFGPSAFNVARTVKALIAAGAGGMHIEDQVGAKGCGHRPNKELVSSSEMSDRVKAAVDARTDPEFVVMARTDALAGEGLGAALDRAEKYASVGADMIFVEAARDLETYRTFAQNLRVPILANMTEFEATPLLTAAELGRAGVGIVLYPLSAFRAANKAAANVFKAIRRDGTQAAVLETMQTRQELYEVIGYDAFEKTQDRLFRRTRDE
jgi:methylisocitrate lyase